MKNIPTINARKIILAAVLLLALLFSSCGKIPEASEAPEAPETQEGPAAPEAPETPEVSEASEAPELPPWTLYETEDYTILLTDTVAPRDREEKFILTMINNSDKQVQCSIIGAVINDTLCSTETAGVSCGPGQVKSRNFSEFNQWYTRFNDDIGDLKKLSLTMVISEIDPATQEEMTTVEEERTIVLPDGYKTTMVFEPSLSMRAQEQILLDTEDVLIELCGLGRVPDDTDPYAITAVVHIVNRTGHSIPTNLPGLRVNGYYIDTTCLGEGRLAAGSERYLLLLCEKLDLEQTGIDQISTLELLILSSDAENTGAYVDTGGAWYPVALSESGGNSDGSSGGNDADSSESSEDVAIYEDEYVAIAFRNAYLDWFETGSGYYHWTFVVTNKSEENIELNLQDLTTVPEGEPNENNIWPKSTEIGANSKIIIELRQGTAENKPVPGIQFRVQVKTLGDGKLLEDSKEVVVVHP